jgi:hypothetical protein
MNRWGPLLAYTLGVLDFAVAGGYLFSRDWTHSAYWFFAGAIALTVTMM